MHAIPHATQEKEWRACLHAIIKTTKKNKKKKHVQSNAPNVSFAKVIWVSGHTPQATLDETARVCTSWLACLLASPLLGLVIKPGVARQRAQARHKQTNNQTKKA
jgi:hypothetical protein